MKTLLERQVQLSSALFRLAGYSFAGNLGAMQHAARHAMTLPMIPLRVLSRAMPASITTGQDAPASAVPEKKRKPAKGRKAKAKAKAKAEAQVEKPVKPAAGAMPKAAPEPRMRKRRAPSMPPAMPEPAGRG